MIIRSSKELTITSREINAGVLPDKIESLYISKDMIPDLIYVVNSSTIAFNYGYDVNLDKDAYFKIDLNEFTLIFRDIQLVNQYYKILLSFIGKETKSIEELYPQLAL